MNRSTIFGTILLLLVATILPASAQTAIDDPEFDAALDWAYDAGMTKYNTQNEFMPQGTLTREQGAKMFSVFAMKNLCMEPDESLVCEFSDLESADPTLQPFLATSCQLGLFQGYNGKFMPKQPLTKAQAITVLVRATEGKMDESQTPRWTPYFTYAQNENLTKETDVNALDKTLTRYEALLIQYRAKSDACTDNTGEYSQELLDLLEELFGAQEVPEATDEEDDEDDEATQTTDDSDDDDESTSTGDQSGTGDTDTGTGTTTTTGDSTSTGDTSDDPLGTGDNETGTGSDSSTGDTQ